MVEAVVLITAIIGAVRGLKLVSNEKINGALTVGVSIALGVVVALLDTEIGVADISVAQGVILGLASAGVANVAEKV